MLLLLYYYCTTTVLLCSYRNVLLWSVRVQLYRIIVITVYASLLYGASSTSGFVPHFSSQQKSAHPPSCSSTTYFTCSSTPQKGTPSLAVSPSYALSNSRYLQTSAGATAGLCVRRRFSLKTSGWPLSELSAKEKRSDNTNFNAARVGASVQRPQLLLSVV